MTNFLIIQTNRKKNKIKIKSFGYSQYSDTKFLNIKRQNNFILKFSIDKNNFKLKINNKNKNNIMNIFVV